jgi:hypothetical protein
LVPSGASIRFRIVVQFSWFDFTALQLQLLLRPDYSTVGRLITSVLSCSF